MSFNLLKRRHKIVIHIEDYLLVIATNKLSVINKVVLIIVMIKKHVNILKGQTTNMPSVTNKNSAVQDQTPPIQNGVSTYVGLP